MQSVRNVGMTLRLEGEWADSGTENINKGSGSMERNLIFHFCLILISRCLIMEVLTEPLEVLTEPLEVTNLTPQD